MNDHPVRVAILDLYNNEPNQGMRCIKELVAGADRKFNQVPVEFDVFETRFKNEIPGLDYDIYISSGGPGSPFDGAGHDWESRYFALVDRIWNFNQTTSEARKYVFFICHSFQMMCRFFNLAHVQQRSRRSFGILPVDKTAPGREDLLLRILPDQFYAADFRMFEAIRPCRDHLKQLGAQVLSREAYRMDPTQEKALMAIRVSDEIVGTQFHPEADPHSMLYHFSQPDRKEQVLREYGENAYERMITELEDPKNISLTRRTVIPRFMLNAIQNLRAN